jgi:hypothetical protein
MAQVVQFQLLPEQVEDLSLIHYKIKEELDLTHDDFRLNGAKEVSMLVNES